MHKHALSGVSTQHILSLYLKECNKMVSDFKFQNNNESQPTVFVFGVFSKLSVLLMSTMCPFTVYNVSFYCLQYDFHGQQCLSKWYVHFGR